MLPNAARYQLRYTPIVIKLWSCKWSNLWSNTSLTAIFCFPNRPKSARLKGFLRFSHSCGAKTAYAPKPPALPAAPHPDFFFFQFRYLWNTMRSPKRLRSTSPMRYAIHGVTSQNILLVVYAQLRIMSRRKRKNIRKQLIRTNRRHPVKAGCRLFSRFISVYVPFSYRMRPPCPTAPPAPARSE